MSQKFDRRAFIKGIAVSGVGVSLAGCGGGEDTPEDGDNGTAENGEDTTEMAGDTYNVGMVYSTGGLGDNSFNDMAHQGIQEAQEDFNVEYSNAEPEQPSEFSNFQRQFATSTDPDYDLIFTIGFSQKSTLQETSSQYTDQKFTIIDETVDAPNVESYVFKEQEGSFQAGIMAGMLTDVDFSAGAGSTNPDQNVVGFVGGKETPLIKRFESGYRFGVKQANPEATINTAYSGSWSDPSGGQSIADSMISDGADVIFHAAGGTGVGVIQAAKEQGRFAIGVDARQSETLPEYADAILGSMVKRVDEAVYRSVSNVINDEFAGGENMLLGLAEDGVALAYGTELGDQIPQEVKDEITAQSERVTSGELTVPETVEEL